MHIFTKISKKACEMNMCWDLSCTTCGSMDLMHEFSQIISSKKDLNRFGHDNKIIDQRELLDAVKDMNIKELMEESCFPDWLGHIGLLLSSCSVVEKKEKILTKKIVPQFLSLLSSESECCERLKHIEDNDEAIQITDLELIENNLKEGRGWVS